MIYKTWAAYPLDGGKVAAYAVGAAAVAAHLAATLRAVGEMGLARKTHSGVKGTARNITFANSLAPPNHNQLGSIWTPAPPGSAAARGTLSISPIPISSRVEF